MLKFKYALLTLSLIEMAVGLSNARPNVFFYLGLPVGVILLGMFLIFQVLEKESALCDEQKSTVEPARNASPPARRPVEICRAKSDTNPTFAAGRSQ